MMKALGLQNSFARDDNDSTQQRSPGQLRASSRGNTKGASVVRNYWAQSARRRTFKSGVKSQSSTLELPLILEVLSPREVSGTPSVEVKFVDIRKNTSGEGDCLAHI
eukprot:TRINITY_DN2746_c0_g1_i6.p5 TRINITY_DN2746_c0_g1~~TRINITY_DN2746_c0_g1_i6.p5  ORF type:complete len:107 (+),score=4.21 TRINITY_DN2746_c0_g1_i6:404-724(+)